MPASSAALRLAPTDAQGAPAGPCVGIFWRVGLVLLVDRSHLPDAEPYGDCLTHAGGHYELWEEWQAIGARGLRQAGYPLQIGTTEYDDWPRGRVVYEMPARRFVIYADRRLQDPATIDRLVEAFGLAEANRAVLSDAHYR